MNPECPVYIISKGRWESRLTSKALEKMGVPYSIVVEPQEHEVYASVIDPRKILVLPFSNLGQGSIPARNWIWEHALATGAARHWILDDNISRFYLHNCNLKIPSGDGAMFRLAEEFTERYENVALAGFQYYMFVPRNRHHRMPFILNTRIYSCILVLNSLPHRWRGRYNEDTDLGLRVLKDGWCTVLFTAFLADKQATMSMRGGNTDELYRGDGRLEMARSLAVQHPDVVRVSWRWGRYQHQVDYRPFRRNALVRRGGASGAGLSRRQLVVLRDGLPIDPASLHGLGEQCHDLAARVGNAQPALHHDDGAPPEAPQGAQVGRTAGSPGAELGAPEPAV